MTGGTFSLIIVFAVLLFLVPMLMGFSGRNKLG